MNHHHHHHLIELCLSWLYAISYIDLYVTVDLHLKVGSKHNIVRDSVWSGLVMLTRRSCVSGACILAQPRPRIDARRAVNLQRPARAAVAGLPQSVEEHTVVVIIVRWWIVPSHILQYLTLHLAHSGATLLVVGFLEAVPSFEEPHHQQAHRPDPSPYAPRLRQLISAALGGESLEEGGARRSPPERNFDGLLKTLKTNTENVRSKLKTTTWWLNHRQGLNLCRRKWSIHFPNRSE